jgi:hypothetical protein
MKGLQTQSSRYIELINEYKEKGHAIAHFNISNLDQARAIVEVAEELKQPAGHISVGLAIVALAVQFQQRWGHGKNSAVCNSSRQVALGCVLAGVGGLGRWKGPASIPGHPGRSTAAPRAGRWSSGMPPVSCSSPCRS